MTKLMKKEGLLNLARRLIESNPDSLHKPDNYLVHLADTYDTAGQIVRETYCKYPNIGKYLLEEEVSLAGGLHDIGRPLKRDQIFHELRGARYVEKKGLYEGVSDNEIDVYRIAQMFRSHFVVAEQFADEQNADEISEFEGLDSGLLTPRTLQEAIVVYSDLSNVNGERVSFQERIENVRKKYDHDPRYKRAIESGLNRVLETCERIQRLKDGTLSEKEIRRYGFI